MRDGLGMSFPGERRYLLNDCVRRNVLNHTTYNPRPPPSPSPTIMTMSSFTAPVPLPPPQSVPLPFPQPQSLFDVGYHSIPSHVAYPLPPPTPRISTLYPLGWGSFSKHPEHQNTFGKFQVACSISLIRIGSFISMSFVIKQLRVRFLYNPTSPTSNPSSVVLSVAFV